MTGRRKWRWCWSRWFWGRNGSSYDGSWESWWCCTGEQRQRSWAMHLPCPVWESLQSHHGPLLSVSFLNGGIKRRILSSPSMKFIRGHIHVIRSRGWLQRRAANLYPFCSRSFRWAIGIQDVWRVLIPLWTMNIRLRNFQVQIDALAFRISLGR